MASAKRVYNDIDEILGVVLESNGSNQKTGRHLRKAKFYVFNNVINSVVHVETISLVKLHITLT